MKFFLRVSPCEQLIIVLGIRLQRRLLSIDRKIPPCFLYLGGIVNRTLHVACNSVASLIFPNYYYQVYQWLHCLSRNVTYWWRHVFSGVIPANGEADICVTYRPTSFETATGKIQLDVAQFNMKPLFCQIFGRSAPGMAQLVLLELVAHTCCRVPLVAPIRGFYRTRVSRVTPIRGLNRDS